MNFSRSREVKWRSFSGSSNNAQWATPKAAIFIFTLFLTVSVAITGCTTGTVIDNVSLPYVTIKQSITNLLPGGVRKQSSNGRSISSQYFVVDKTGQYRGLSEDEAETVPERAYAEVVILGERRPYRLDVRIFREKRDRKNKRYYSPEIDRSLSETFSKAVKESLANRREDRNVIDDFRAF